MKSDLTDEELQRLEDAANGWTAFDRGQSNVLRLVDEVKRHRSAISADKERVRQVVIDAAISSLPEELWEGGFDAARPMVSRLLFREKAADAIAARVADQLATSALCFPPSHPTTLGDVWVGETKPVFTTSAPKLTADEIRQLEHHIRDHQATCAYSCSIIERLLAGARSAEPAPKLTEKERNHLLSIRSHLSERRGHHSSVNLWGDEMATIDRLLSGAR